VSDYFDRIERQIVRRVEAGVPRGSRFPLRLVFVAPALSVLVVVAIVVVFLGVHRSNAPGSGVGRGGGVEFVYQAEPTAQTPAVTRAALERTIAVMRQRAAALGVSGGSFRVSGGNEITVQLPNFKGIARVEKIVGETARLEFYDWEATALTPNGKTVASQLQAQDPTALTTSQGSGTGSPGDPGAGSMPLYDAVKLASKQPPQVSPDNTRLGPQYYLFGPPGSAACASAARDQSQTPAPKVHCLLAGPDDTRADLLSGLHSGVSESEGQLLVVPPGTVVLQASDPSSSQQTDLNDPNAQFYVLKDHVSLSGTEITNPQQRTDQSGNPDVTFSFTPRGRTAFQKLTSTIAHRGELASSLGQQLNQHFAVALDTKLVTVPQIDFKTYPNGVQAGGGDITAGLTIQSARDLATQLRLGMLPVNLRLISEKQLSVHG
jgi:SecD/SecF fusion protein